MNYSAAAQKIAASSYKMTRARELILRALVKMKGPFTAHEILAKCSKSRVDLATIYRNLPIFEELELICKSDFSDEVSRYMVTDKGHDHHHHHIICRSCEKIEPVDFCILQAQEQILARLGFSSIRHRLEFSGLCANCA